MMPFVLRQLTHTLGERESRLEVPKSECAHELCDSISLNNLPIGDLGLECRYFFGRYLRGVNPTRYTSLPYKLVHMVITRAFGTVGAA